jgi:hypothetical protein
MPTALQEGASLARWLSCLLQPAHHDPHSQQALEFPGLNGLPASHLTALRHKFFHSDDRSFFHFYTSLLVGKR